MVGREFVLVLSDARDFVGLVMLARDVIEGREEIVGLVVVEDGRDVEEVDNVVVRFEDGEVLVGTWRL